MLLDLKLSDFPCQGPEKLQVLQAMWSSCSEAVTAIPSAAISTKESSGSSSVPIKLCAQKLAVVWMWPGGSSLLTSAPDPRMGALEGQATRLS